MDKVVIINRKARRDYGVIKIWEAGIELKGSEIKSIRAGCVNLNESFARIVNGQVLLYNMHISNYAQASFFNVDELRIRRLLLHKGQINKITTELFQQGLTLVPLRVYINQRGFVKVELALCRGKKMYDRRESIKRREIEMQLRKVLKNRRR
ncbi:MAG: SsrA-binding protein SmpB [Candidatus Omnitrophota bacterium]